MAQRLLLIALAGMLAASSFAVAQNVDIVKARQASLKAMGDAAKPMGAVLKGEAPFDLAKAQAALDTFIAEAGKLPDMFPDDSKTGGDTATLPAAWEKKDDFTARFTKLVAEAKAAKGTITDEFSFQEAFPKVVGNCGACHKIYRAEKK
ncbi:MAG: cytochrome c [Hyphomicrobiaceae bacterium]|nr:cytochrome c [Hyphomicrobiaceae bacterium]